MFGQLLGSLMIVMFASKSYGLTEVIIGQGSTRSFPRVFFSLMGSRIAKPITSGGSKSASVAVEVNTCWFSILVLPATPLAEAEPVAFRPQP